MIKKTLKILFCLLLMAFGNQVWAQQWSGSNSNIGHIRREGDISIGTTASGAKLRIDADNGNGILMERNNNIYVNTQARIGISSSGGIPGLRMSISADNGSTFTDGLFIRENANVGIATTLPSYKLHVNGSVGKPGGGSWTNASDLRLKQEVEPFTDGLEVLQKINPVWYRYNGKADLPTDEKYVGIIAQDMQKVVPYTIGTFNHEDEEGNITEYLDYNSSAVTYITINAIKEQQELITTLQQRIKELERLVANTKETAGSLQSKDVENNSEGFTLLQNTPNPFSTNTVIKAIVPENVNRAKIVVYNLQGLELESYSISGRGNVAVEISSGRFSSGIYIYALIADEQIIDTKKMILTK